MTLKQIKEFIKKNGVLDIETVYCYNTEPYSLDYDNDVLGLYYDVDSDDVYALVMNTKDESRFILLSEEVMSEIISKDKR